MSTRAKKRKGAAKQPVLFITKPQLAQALGVDPGSIDDWVAAGTFPPPHSRLGDRTVLWRRDYFDHFVEHREWPRESFYRPGGGS
jgi:predicted DNA-binding transcriptional regulator AlpA